MVYLGVVGRHLGQHFGNTEAYFFLESHDGIRF
jgi:hypothetical protein